jgi:hypothetical protein
MVERQTLRDTTPSALQPREGVDGHGVRLEPATSQTTTWRSGEERADAMQSREDRHA